MALCPHKRTDSGARIHTETRLLRFSPGPRGARIVTVWKSDIDHAFELPWLAEQLLCIKKTAAGEVEELESAVGMSAFEFI